MTPGRRELVPLAAAGAALAAAAFGRPAQAQAPAQGLDSVLRNGKLRVGYITSPPGISKDPNTGDLGGIYVDALRMILEQAKIEPVFVETIWANFVAGLQSNQFDLCIAGTFATVPRATVVHFTKPICYLGMSACVKADDTRFKSLADLNKEGITIAAVQGDAAVDYIRANFPKAHLVTVTTGNLAAPFIEVSAGRADVGIEDASQAHRYALAHPEVKDLFGHDPFNVLPIAWTVNQGNVALLTFMNTAIDWLMVNDRFNKIGAQYPDNGRYVEQLKFTPLGVA